MLDGGLVRIADGNDDTISITALILVMLDGGLVQINM